MAYVTVDVDVSDFRTDDLCDDLRRRLSSTAVTKMTPNQRKKLLSDIEAVLAELHLPQLKTRTLDDRMKWDVVVKYWDKLTCYQFEEKLSK